MARLPTPGGDDGTWGNLLNEYLQVTHAGDGTLKNGIVTNGKIADGAITGQKLADDAVDSNTIADSSITVAKLDSSNSPTSGQVLSYDGTSFEWIASGGSVPDATSGTKGILRLTNDLGGTADSPTVPGLGDKADSSTVTAHTSNTSNPHSVTIAQLLGSASMTITLATSTIEMLRVNIPDDGSSTGTWPDRFAFYFDGSRTGYHNEYGELRARPAKNSTVAFRTQSHSSGTTLGNIMEVTNSGNSVIYFAVSQSQVTANVPVITPNLPAKVTVSATEPSSPATGDVWIDTSA